MKHSSTEKKVFSKWLHLPSIFSIPPPKADYRVKYGAEALNFMDIRIPKRSGLHPVLFVLHGGFWKAEYDSGHMGHLCSAFTKLGVATCNVEYRRVGHVGGGWPGTFQDLAFALDKLTKIGREYNFDMDRIVVLGHSSGGHLAFWLAGLNKLEMGELCHYNPAPRFSAAVSLAGILDLWEAWRLRVGIKMLEKLLGGTPEKFPDRYNRASPAALLPLGIQQLLIHGKRDRVVPYTMSEHYYKLASSLGDDVTLLSPPTGHFGLIDPYSKVWSSVVASVLPLLGFKKIFPSLDYLRARWDTRCLNNKEHT
jgi:acetyl esterase/lipase